jgi:hypothetical protein
MAPLTKPEDVDRRQRLEPARSPAADNTSGPGHRAWKVALAVVSLCVLAASGQERWAPDKPEPGSVEAIARFTTEPRCGNPSVAYVPDSPTVPSPAKFLGHIAGAPVHEAPAGDGAMVVSGGAKGEDTLEGRPAMLEVLVAGGRVIAYNFNPMHRDLNRSDCRLLWNAVLYWQAIGR